ncbi:hypothetical protein NC652_037105 [Populus alba x Populus x berolinensis]|nr:hypothetical protein NC652_037105 [Populus alba x Populus x berolinensis]
MIKLLQWLSSHKTVRRAVLITELRLRSLSFLFHISCLFKMLRLFLKLLRLRFLSGALSPKFDHLLDLFFIFSFRF